MGKLKDMFLSKLSLEDSRWMVARFNQSLKDDPRIQKAMEIFKAEIAEESQTDASAPISHSPGVQAPRSGFVQSCTGAGDGPRSSGGSDPGSLHPQARQPQQNCCSDRSVASSGLIRTAQPTLDQINDLFAEAAYEARKATKAT